MISDQSIENLVPLRRRLGLPLLVMYGTGITVGAGIFVLIGAVAGHSGIYAPWSFVLAAVVMGLTVASYAELSTRFPVSVREAAYVRAVLIDRLSSSSAPLSLVFREVAMLAQVSSRTGTPPLVATALVVATVVPLALFVPLVSLAEGTSLATLGVFALVNLSLLRLRYRGVQSKTPHVTIPILFPAAGFATCIAMMAIAFLK